MNELVSFIIPVYNVEKYLDRSMESVLGQTHKNLQVILINDGSTDNSPKMCDLYAEKDSRVSVVHIKNAGSSVARNEGLKHAKGEYIAFLDSDDYIATHTIEYMLKLCKDQQCEISIMSTKHVPEHMMEEVPCDIPEEIRVLTSEEAIAHTMYQKLFSCTVWGKLYHKDIVENLVFPVGKLSQDLAVSHLLFHKAKRIAYSNQVGFFYRQNPAGITYNFRIGRMDALTFSLEVEEYCKIHYPKLEKAAKLRTFNVSTHLILDMPDTGEIREECLPRLWKELKRTRMSVLFNTKARFREKAACILSFFGEMSMKKVWRSKMAVRQGNV